MAPYYRKLLPQLQERGIPLFMDTDGDVTLLVPWLEALGVCGVLPLERQAGVDGLKLRQQNLLGSYDAFLPLNDQGTKLFGGGTLGLTKLEQESSGYKRDSDIGYAIGAQAGVLQNIGKNASIEGGYRYLRTNASTEMSPHGGSKAGSLDLHSSSQIYLGANYRF